MNPQLLTIIICTYNRSRFLDLCLDSLTKQTIPNHQFRIIVVNNNSTDDTSEIVKKHIQSFDSLEEIIEKKTGLSIARNTGYKKSNTDWVAYLDDDAIAHEDWIEQIFYTIKHHDFKCFGGIYLPWYLDGKEKWFLDNYSSNKHFFKRKGIYSISTKKYIAGCNMVFELDSLKKSNGFPSELGMSGKMIGYGEELYVQNKIRSMGYSLGINTNLLIKHYVHSYKQNVQWFKSSYQIKGKTYWEGRKKTFLRLLIFTAQGIISVSYKYLSSTAKLLMKGYYKENFIIDTQTKYLLYSNAIKNYFLKEEDTNKILKKGD
ncbi:MAG: glycosyltransferase family 2 protein [Cyclobacteriaceae bacterium]